MKEKKIEFEPALSAKHAVILFTTIFAKDRTSDVLKRYLSSDCEFVYSNFDQSLNFEQFREIVVSSRNLNEYSELEVDGDVSEIEVDGATKVMGRVDFFSDNICIFQSYLKIDCKKENENWVISKFSIENKSESVCDCFVEKYMSMGYVFACTINENVNLCCINDDLCSELGFTSQQDRREQSGNSIYNLIFRDDVDLLYEYSKSLINGERPKDIFVRLKNFKLETIWFAVHGDYRNLDNTDYLIFTCNNIDSIMKSREEDKEESNKKKLAVVTLENLPSMVHSFNLVERTLDYISEDFCSVTGYSIEEIKERFDNKYTPMVHEDDREIFIKAIKSIYNVQQTITIEYRLVCKDGKSLPVIGTIRSVHHNYEDRWEGYSSMTVVTESLYHDSENYEFFNKFPNCVVIGEYDGLTMKPIFRNNYAKSVLALGDFDNENGNCPICGAGNDCEKIRDSLMLLYKGKRYVCDYANFETKDGIEKFFYTMYLEKIEPDKLTFSLYLTELTNHFSESMIEAPENKKRIKVRTFGYFDVFVDDVAIPFHNTKAKELLALLVDRRGGIVTTKDAVTALWEDEPITPTTLARARKVVMRLMDELREFGIEDMVVSDVNGQKSINVSTIDCDLYDYLADEEKNKNLFKGSYMTNYSWGEYTLANLWNE